MAAPAKSTHIERLHLGNTGSSTSTIEECASTSIQNLLPPTKFQRMTSTCPQPSEIDKRRIAESLHEEFGRMIARDESARWSCTADELEEISTSVADYLIMLMQTKDPKP
jgi:hypothetical protein